MRAASTSLAFLLPDPNLTLPRRAACDELVKAGLGAATADEQIAGLIAEDEALLDALLALADELGLALGDEALELLARHEAARPAERYLTAPKKGRD